MTVKATPLSTSLIINKTEIQALELDHNTSDKVNWLKDNLEYT